MARRTYEVLDEAGGVTLLWPSPEARELEQREPPRPEQRGAPRPEPARRLLGFSPPGSRAARRSREARGSAMAPQHEYTGVPDTPSAPTQINMSVEVEPAPKVPGTCTLPELRGSDHRLPEPRPWPR